ncbi:Cytochrome C biogenesis protein [Duganella sp. CF458]|uniref:cytochrome c-type biogenesis protein n=1 Tax=Duganella sp. CF458 TaxID=1884368 RepID=UPI0008E26195|nr:cytochrome c-type biogenesis protein [Duganella sp. CF458]SFG44701.1 Cytochrome C biogenesis protein [Duganella sp. CF458]
MADTASTTALEARTMALAGELRCLVCQNQSLADSHAPLALDLRDQIQRQLAQGRSEQQVVDFMVQRYGDFVLYEPPLNPSTALLWFGPLLLLAAGVVALRGFWRSKQ